MIKIAKKGIARINLLHEMLTLARSAPSSAMKKENAPPIGVVQPTCSLKFVWNLALAVMSAMPLWALSPLPGKSGIISRAIKIRGIVSSEPFTIVGRAYLILV